MLQQLRMTARLIVLALGVVIGPHLPQSSLQVILLVLVGAALLAPWVVAAGRQLVGLSTGPPGPPASSRLVDAPTRRLPGAPGTPGAALVRAPSGVVPAFA